MRNEADWNPRLPAFVDINVTLLSRRVMLLKSGRLIDLKFCDPDLFSPRTRGFCKAGLLSCRSRSTRTSIELRVNVPSQIKRHRSRICMLLGEFDVNLTLHDDRILRKAWLWGSKSWFRSEPSFPQSPAVPQIREPTAVDHCITTRNTKGHDIILNSLSSSVVRPNAISY